MSWQVEALAAALLLANVWLVARRSLWNYAFGIAAVSLYAAVFLEARLYAAFGLQFLFLALNLYGLANWRQAQADDGEVTIGRLTGAERIGTVMATLKLGMLVGLLLWLTTDAALPFWDAGNTAVALAAQYWQARRRVETWPLWCLVNIGSVGLYATQALWFTAAVYAVLLLVALYGWREWQLLAALRDERGV
ncbi:MAG: nicotinamide riboside transporter PnuC [Sandaracinobacter sp.]